jgi:hypothetical protein
MGLTIRFPTCKFNALFLEFGKIFYTFPYDDDDADGGGGDKDVVWYC